MQANIFKEITGVQLYSEYEQFMDEETYTNVKNRLRVLNKEQKVSTDSVNRVRELYFYSSLDSNTSSNGEEQFLISVGEVEEQTYIVLKKRSKVGKLCNERFVSLTGEQFKRILKGQFEWMKQAAELLINEFYHKLKLFDYYIGMILECTREQYLLKANKRIITVDNYNKRISSYQYNRLEMPSEGAGYYPACIRVKSN